MLVHISNCLIHFTLNPWMLTTFSPFLLGFTKQKTKTFFSFSFFPLRVALLIIVKTSFTKNSQNKIFTRPYSL